MDDVGPDGSSKRRSVTAQGMPSDLRVMLLGWKYADKDGRASDPTIVVILAYRFGLGKDKVAPLIEYLLTDDARDKWHRDVAEHHGVDRSLVKRWPNILGNGGTWETCAKQAGIDASVTAHEHVKKMSSMFKSVRVEILCKLRDSENSLWPGSHTMFRKCREMADKIRPELDDREKVNKIFSWCIQTVEDHILRIHAEAQRQVRREALGSDKFDALVPAERDQGGYAFDGMLVPVEAGVDRALGDRAAERAIADRGWHANEWGIGYKIVEKPMYHGPDADPLALDPNKLQVAVDSRDVLRRRRPAGVASM